MSARPGPSSLPLAPPGEPHCADTASEFFQVLTAPHHPHPQPPPLHRAQPRPAHVARCRAAINWTPSLPVESSNAHASRASSHPASRLDQPLYQPHGCWAWTHGLPFDDPKQLLSLRKGAQCSASIDSGTVANKEIKYICRRWKTSKQKEWYGFYSELALYNSEQYLRPLQGDVVPHIIGVHIMPESVSMTMEMPHSSFWIESSPSMPHVLKERVIAAFAKIHAQGVLHGDPELRHMLVGADGNVMIIDFGMSRAIREHPSVGIEGAEPEEFRLEMRKVKYKLDYLGARKKEGDKVDDYLRRVRRNRKISELWKRRAKGERVGPIPQYEEDPEEYELDPPVNAHDFQQDWITASDDTPMRVVVPGQTSEQVASQVQAFLGKVDEMCATSSSPTLSASRSEPAHPCTRHPESAGEASPQHPQPCGPEGSDENRQQFCRTRTKRRPRRDQPRQVASRCEDDLFPLSARYIEGASLRRDYMRHKHLKNTYISSLSSNPHAAAAFPSSIDTPQKQRSLKPEECRKIQESRRQAMVEYSRAPNGILKRRRDDDDAADGPAAAAGCHPPSPCKKRRFLEQLFPAGARRRTPFSDSSSGRRPLGVVQSRSHRRLKIARPELVNFTLPSLRTLSALVGSLMPWVQCPG